MERKNKIKGFIDIYLRENDIYDSELIDLLENICKSAYEHGTCNNSYLEELKKVVDNNKRNEEIIKEVLINKIVEKCEGETND